MTEDYPHRELAGFEATARCMEQVAEEGDHFVVLLLEGELAATIAGEDIGGPNQECDPALANSLSGMNGISVLAADADGTDGGKGSAVDPAGAYVFRTSIERARALGLDPALFLVRNDSSSFSEAPSDLPVPGPTYTNVNDFRAIVVDNIGVS